MAGLASGIRKAPHLKAMVDMAEQSMSGLDLTKILMYIVDAAPSSALDSLARQFGLGGYGGLLFAGTDEEKRELIKIGIQLQSKKGTPFAIKQAVLGANDNYTIVQVNKTSGVLYDGDEDYDGNITHAGGFWAQFSVTVVHDDSYTPDSADTDIVTNLVNHYKNERSALIAVNFITETDYGSN